MKTTINTCIMITVNNPSAAVMEYLAKLPSIDASIASVADIDNYLDIGTEVHWHGQKYVFDGVVEQINDSALEDDHGNANDTGDDKAIFIRRNDTDKLVSLTLRDLQTGRLTLID